MHSSVSTSSICSTSSATSLSLHTRRFTDQSHRTIDRFRYPTSTTCHQYVERLCYRSITLPLKETIVPVSNMESSPLGTLPPELIFRILDFLNPLEYTGFPCTCQHALSLVNHMLDTPENHNFTALDEDRRSWTAAFVQAKRLSLDGSFAMMENWQEGLSDCSARCYHDESEDDAYL
jgi:hypothetical protein